MAPAAQLYLLDTNAVSDVMADHPKVKSRLAKESGRIITCAIVRGEIRYGLERLLPSKRRTNLEAKAVTVFAALPIEPITLLAADTYGTVRRAVELAGITMDDNDLWIASAALSLAATVVSRDQGFNQVPGLAVEDWTQ